MHFSVGSDDRTSDGLIYAGPIRLAAKPTDDGRPRLRVGSNVLATGNEVAQPATGTTKALVYFSASASARRGRSRGGLRGLAVEADAEPDWDGGGGGDLSSKESGKPESPRKSPLSPRNTTRLNEKMQHVTGESRCFRGMQQIADRKPHRRVRERARARVCMRVRVCACVRERARARVCMRVRVCACVRLCARAAQ